MFRRSVSGFRSGDGLRAGFGEMFRCEGPPVITETRAGSGGVVACGIGEGHFLGSDSGDDALSLSEFFPWNSITGCPGNRKIEALLAAHAGLLKSSWYPASTSR